MWHVCRTALRRGILGRGGFGGSLKESDHLVNLGVAVTVLYTLIFKK